MRECGCEDRGRHKRTCLKHIEKSEISIEKENATAPKSLSLHELYTATYGATPHLFWYPNRARQKTVERRIEKLVRRYKSFYLTTSSLDNPSEEEEMWYIDGGNWASKIEANGYNKLIGHIKNCLEFLNGRQPKWTKRRSKS